MDKYIISDWNSFAGIINRYKTVYIWGAGMKTMLLVEASHINGLNIDIKAIIVSECKSNFKSLFGASVKALNDCVINKNDVILVSTMSIYWDDIAEFISDANCNANVYYIDESLEGIGHIGSLQKSLKPFIHHFNPDAKSAHGTRYSRIIWSCWWQGEDQAPELVKACWRSWRRYIPNSYEIKIITQDNYRDYIDIPDDIMNRVVEGVTKLQPVTDIIRMQLLYRYGGIWMDSTTYLTAELPASEIENYDIYTYHLPSHDYGSDTSWTVWFMGGRPGELLFRFVYESLIWYLMRNDNVLFYLQIDYTIALATKLFPKILEQFDKVPIRNGNPSDLRRRLESTFDKQEYKKICNRCQIHKLSWYGYKYQAESFMDYIINS